MGGGWSLAMGGMTATQAAEILERIAIGDEGEQRDATVLKLARGQHPDFKRIVREAIWMVWWLRLQSVTRRM